MKHLFPLLLVSATGAVTAQSATCKTPPPNYHATDECTHTYWLRPVQSIANAPTRPFTPNGDWEITVAGLYWKPHIDGLEFGIETAVRLPDQAPTGSAPWVNLIDATYKDPKFTWDLGFRFGLGHNTTCDGWDIGVAWTHFHSSSQTLNHLQVDDNRLLDGFFSDFGGPPFSAPSIVLNLEADWSLHLDLVDLLLGREHWVSPKLSLCPSIGLRYGKFDQSYTILNRGRKNEINQTLPSYVLSDNDWVFKGVGIIGGLDTNWHLGWGWSFFGKLAISNIYGRFSIDQDISQINPNPPFEKNRHIEMNHSFRAGRSALDLALGVEWFALFCECSYRAGVRLGWEQHLFFHQNQLWIERNSVSSGDFSPLENIYSQRTGTLSTGGWSLTFQFDF